MHRIQKVIDFIYVILTKIKGKRKLAFFPLTKKVYTTLEVVTIYGYDIKIHCKCVAFKYVYKKNYLPTKRYYVYSAYGECDDKAPEALKKIIKTKIYFPRLVPFYVSAQANNKIIVEAYLDILISKLRNEKTL